MPIRRLSEMISSSGFSPGAWVVIVLAVLSTLTILIWRVPQREGLEMWTFTRVHYPMYEPVAKAWNAEPAHKDKQVNVYLLDNTAMRQRLMSGFLSDTPIADLLEVERNMACLAFSGPLEDIGFVDLTDRLKQEGLYDRINEPSFSPWTSRGRIFGLPHDVHPVLLAYRADIVEEAGIDIGSIETWEEFARVMRPLVKDLDGDGKADRYPFYLWITGAGHYTLLMEQAGGGLFDDQQRLTINDPVNAYVLANCVSWMVGPDRIAIDAQPFTAGGNYLRLEGRVVCELMADWMAGAWKNDLPGLGGKLKLMPLPAWERDPQRRHAGVMGGTMLGIAKSSENFDDAWEFARHLYLDRDMAEKLYRSNSIITPVREFWDMPVYDEPDPYFSGQPAGRLFVNQAPYVPLRTSSPFNNLAMNRTQKAIIAVYEYAVTNKVYDANSLEPEAQRQLDLAQAHIRGLMDRNVFLKDEQP